MLDYDARRGEFERRRSPAVPARQAEPSRRRGRRRRLRGALLWPDAWLASRWRIWSVRGSWGRSFGHFVERRDGRVVVRYVAVALVAAFFQQRERHAEVEVRGDQFAGLCERRGGRRVLAQQSSASSRGDRGCRRCRAAASHRDRAGRPLRREAGGFPRRRRLCWASMLGELASAGR